MCFSKIFFGKKANFCYFVLDFVPCGDLHHVLEMKKRLTEAETKFFICEAILGLNAIHTNNFLYRDLKVKATLHCSSFDHYLIA